MPSYHLVIWTILYTINTSLIISWILSKKTKGLQNRPFREIEYKTLLDKEEYQSSSTFAVELVVQTNRYIDTPDQLIRKEKWPCGCVLTDQAVLTLRSLKQLAISVQSRPQLKKPRRPSTPTVSLTGEIKNLLISKIPLNTSLSQGSLTTEQFEKETAAGMVTLTQSLS